MVADGTEPHDGAATSPAPGGHRSRAPVPGTGDPPAADPASHGSDPEVPGAPRTDAPGADVPRADVPHADASGAGPRRSGGRDAPTTPAAKVAVSALLRDRGLRGLAVAELASALGSGIVALAVTYETFRSTGSLLRTVLVTAAYTLPAALFGIPAGRLADHHHRRPILVGLYAAKAGTYGLLAVMSFAGVLDANGLLVASFVAGTLSAFAFPAWEEYEKDLIPPSRLAAANALFSSMSSVAGLVGAVAGGVIVARIGLTAAFVVDAVSFAPMIVVLVGLHPTETVHRGRGHDAGAVREVLRAVRTQPPIRRSLRNVAMISLLAAPVAQLLPAVARAVGTGPDALGTVTAAYALGGTAVAWAITRLRAVFDLPAMIPLAIMMCAGALVAFGLGGLALGGAPLVGVIVVSLLFVGLALSLAQSVLSAVLQLHAPAEVEGPVFAVYGILYSVLAPLGAVVVGRLAGSTDVFAVIAALGVALVAWGCFVLVDHRRARANGELPPRDDPAVLRAHAGAWGLGHGLFAHHHLRFPLTIGQRPWTARRADGPDA